MGGWVDSAQLKDTFHIFPPTIPKLLLAIRALLAFFSSSVRP